MSNRLVVVACCWLWLIVPARAKDLVRDSVVQVHVTQRQPDYQRPWAKGEPIKSSGSGVIVGHNRILTNWHVVQYASQVLVQLNQSTDKEVAVVEAVAPDMDLALVRLERESALDGHPALEFSDGVPPIRATVNVYGFPLGGEDMSVTEGIVSRIEFSRYNFEAAGLRIQVDAALNPGNSGGPAVIGDKLVGIVFSKINQGEDIGYLIPVEEIRMFLEDVADGEYDGKPMLFDEVQSTENDALRDSLRLNDATGGVVVRKPYDLGHASYPLQAWDVITHIGQTPIDKQGNVAIRDDLRVDYRYLVPQVTKHGVTPLRILRNGSSMDVEVPVRTQQVLLMPVLRGKYPDHFILGPLSFTTATQEFVASLGVKGYVFLSGLNSPLFERRLEAPAFDGEQLVVMPSRLFTHRMIKGYANMPFGVLTHINNTPVKNIRHVVEILRDTHDEFLTFKFGGNHETLIFRLKDLRESTEEILEAEGIRYQASRELDAIWRLKGD